MIDSGDELVFLPMGRMISLSHGDISVEAVESSVRTSACGASLVLLVEYSTEVSPYCDWNMKPTRKCISSMEQIVAEAKGTWNAVAIVHRLGGFTRRDPVVIAVATPHRGASYETNRFV